MFGRIDRISVFKKTFIAGNIYKWFNIFGCDGWSFTNKVVLNCTGNMRKKNIIM